MLPNFCGLFVYKMIAAFNLTTLIAKMYLQIHLSDISTFTKYKNLLYKSVEVISLFYYIFRFLPFLHFLCELLLSTALSVKSYTISRNSVGNTS